jgi:hypothetical protein
MVGAICDELLLKVLPIKQPPVNTRDLRRIEQLLSRTKVQYLSKGPE